MNLKTVNCINLKKYHGVHIETPLGIVNIYLNLTNRKDQRVETIELLPNEYASEKKVKVQGFKINRFIELKTVKN